MFNKMLLFTGMYHHHKVRAVDCMLWAVFELAQQRSCNVGGRKLVTCVDFLWVTDDRLLIPELCNDTDIQKLLRDIRDRRLWKKALVIARNTVPPEMHSKSAAENSAFYYGVAKLAGDDKSKVDERRRIAKLIWEKAGKPCEAFEVWLDVPKLPPMTEAKKLWIQAPGQETPQTLGDFIPVDKWVELYGSHQSRYHVFSPPTACKAIGQAAKEVFDELFGLKFLPEATAFAKP